MSIQNNDFGKASAAAKRRHPIVLRFASMFPSALARFEMHAARRGGDLSHVDPSKTAQNRVLIGSADWRKRLEKEIALARAENFAEELEALVRRKRAKERKARLLEGMRDPWRASDGGPLREVILTANRLWFEEAAEDGTTIDARRARFEQAAVEWLHSRFPGHVIHARGELDEMTYHIHAVIAPWQEDTTTRRGKQRLLVPTAHPLLNNYELAQEDAGAFFAGIGLDRGRRTKEAQREAGKKKKARERLRDRIREAGDKVPEALSDAFDPEVPSLREHVPAPVWWKAERERIAREKGLLVEAKAQADADAARLTGREAALAQREAATAERERDAVEVVELVEAIADGRTPKVALPSGSLGARLIAGLKSVQAGMRRSVEAKVAEEKAAAQALAATVTALRDKIVKSIPASLLGVFMKAIASEESAVEAAKKRLDASATRGEKGDR